jgi:hypothetical protein
MRLQCYPIHVLRCKMQSISHIAAIRTHILIKQNIIHYILKIHLEDKLTTLNIQCKDVFEQNQQPSEQFLNYLATYYSQ